MALSKTRRAELEAELLQTMDKLDALKVDLREQLQEHREQVKLHATKLKELRDILSGREGEQLLVPGTESGTVKPRAALPAKGSGAMGLLNRKDLVDLAVTARRNAGLATPTKPPARPRARGEIIRWCADQRARKVPNFVIEQTGLKTKAAVIAKYGEGVTFEMAKPTPQTLADYRASGKTEKPKQPRLAAGCLIRWGEPDHAGVVSGRAGRDTYKITPYPDGGWRWECPGGGGASPKVAGDTLDDTKARCEDRAKSRARDVARALKAKPKPAPAAPRPVAWTEGDGTLQVVVGSITYRAQEITPTRWVLESKSERERAWHKESVLASQAECEKWLVERNDGITFAEKCLDCGVAADQPSPGCEECDHGKAVANG